MFVRTCVRACVRAYLTLENIVHSISRGRTVTICWNLVCVCNKYQWWYSDLNIPGNWQQSRFPEFSVLVCELDYFKSWVALISIFRSIAIVAFLSRIVHSKLNQMKVGCSQRYLCLGCLCSGWESMLYGIAQFKKIWSWCSVRYWVLHNVFLIRP